MTVPGNQCAESGNQCAESRVSIMEGAIQCLNAAVGVLSNVVDGLTGEQPQPPSPSPKAEAGICTGGSAALAICLDAWPQEVTKISAEIGDLVDRLRNRLV